MAGVLTTASRVECGHSGSVATTSSAKLTVGGSPVLIHPSSINGKSVAGCATLPSSDSSGPIDVTCTSVSSVTAGAASKLTSGGQPVTLDTLAGATDGLVGKTPNPALGSPDAGQDKLTAI